MSSKNEPTTLEKVFSLFLYNKQDHKEYAPTISNPFIDGDYIYATDKQSLVRCKTELINFQYFQQTKEPPPSMGKVIPTSNIPIELNLDIIDWGAIMNEDELSYIGVDIDCGHCNGEGTATFSFIYNNTSYQAEYECPVCKASGLEARRIGLPNGNKVFKKTALVKMGSIYFLANNFYKLKKASDLLGEKITLQSDMLDEKPILFNIGFLDIVLLSKPNDIDDYDVVAKIPINT